MFRRLVSRFWISPNHFKTFILTAYSLALQLPGVGNLNTHISSFSYDWLTF